MMRRCLMALLLLMALPAEGAPWVNDFGGAPDGPVSIEADRLEVNQSKRRAVFDGNVRATQGLITLEAATITVFYDAPADLALGTPKVNRLKASGNVRLTGKNAQTAKGSWAEYNVRARRITMGGNVILQQGAHVLSGDRLEINLISGKSRMTSLARKDTPKDTPKDAPSGRVRALFGTDAPDTPEEKKKPR